MPRMNVNLQPATVKFNDGEDPIVSGLARFGETMSQLPLQMAQLRMEQDQQQTKRDQFGAMHSLRMKANDREQAAFDDQQVYNGAVPAEFADPMNPTPDELSRWDRADAGRKDREAGRYHAPAMPHQAGLDPDNGPFSHNQQDGTFTYARPPGAGAAPRMPAMNPGAGGEPDNALNLPNRNAAIRAGTDAASGRSTVSGAKNDQQNRANSDVGRALAKIDPTKLTAQQHEAINAALAAHWDGDTEALPNLFATDQRIADLFAGANAPDAQAGNQQAVQQANDAARMNYTGH